MYQVGIYGRCLCLPEVVVIPLFKFLLVDLTEELSLQNFRHMAQSLNSKLVGWLDTLVRSALASKDGAWDYRGKLRTNRATTAPGHLLHN